MVGDTFMRFRMTQVGKDLLVQLEKIEAKKRSNRKKEIGRK